MWRHAHAYTEAGKVVPPLGRGVGVLEGVALWSCSSCRAYRSKTNERTLYFFRSHGANCLASPMKAFT